MQNILKLKVKLILKTLDAIDGHSFNYPRTDIYGIFLIPDIKN